MSGRFDVKVLGTDRVKSALRAKAERIREALLRAQVINGKFLVGYVVSRKLHGDPIHQRSGRLARSIHDVVTDRGESIDLTVGTNVEYARILEDGGHTRPHVIVPKNGKALAFISGGAQVFARRVNHPGSNFPARPFLKSSLNENRDAIRERLRGAVHEAIRS